jgi:hypothetical protein
MSEQCAITACEQLSFGECDCCHRSICKRHLSEHYNFLIDHWNPLMNEVNTLTENMKLFDVRHCTSESREKLEQWRIECHEKIERLFQEKSTELDQYLGKRIDEQTQNIEHLRTRLVELLNDQDTYTNKNMDSLIASVERLKQDMLHIEQAYVQIRIRPFMIDNAMLQLLETIRPVIDLSQLSTPHKVLEDSSKSYSILTSNDEYLLVHQSPSLCLIDSNMRIVQRIVWPFKNIVDACWSSGLNSFIMISDHDIFLLKDSLTHAERIPTQQNSPWLSGTCSDTSIFLSADESMSSIYIFDQLPIITYVNRWIYPVENDQHMQIDSMAYSNGTLALVIRCHLERSLHIELRFSSTFDCLWSLALDIIPMKKRTFQCCSLNFDEWLVTDYQNNSFVHIGKSGQMKRVQKYPTTPYHVHLFKRHIFIVLTKSSKNIHRLV